MLYFLLWLTQNFEILRVLSLSLTSPITSILSPRETSGAVPGWLVTDDSAEHSCWIVYSVFKGSTSVTISVDHSFCSVCENVQVLKKAAALVAVISAQPGDFCLSIVLLLHLEQKEKHPLIWCPSPLHAILQVGVFNPTAPNVFSFLCPSGFDAMRGQFSLQGQQPVTQLAFRCDWVYIFDLHHWDLQVPLGNFAVQELLDM